MRVGIVGGGIVGLCSAMALHQRNIEVVLFDEGVIPAPRAASNDRRRLLRHAYPQQVELVSLVDEAVAAWQRLWQVLGQCFYHRTGVLALQRRDGDFAALTRQAFDDVGVDYRLLTPNQLSDEFSFINSNGVQQGIHCDQGGVLKADRILSALTHHLDSAGVQLEPGMAAKSVDLERGRISLENGEVFEADRLILATGAWTAGLLGESNGMVSQRQVVVHAQAPAELRQQWQQAPAIVDFGTDAGAYVVPPAGDRTLTLGLESIACDAPVDASRIPRTNEGVRLVESFRPFLSSVDDYRIERTRVCFYSTTADGLWRLRSTDRTLALAGCNGHMFKFGALIGELLAGWVDNSVDCQQLRRILPVA